MHRKIWFLAAAAVAVFALTGSASAGRHYGYQWHGKSLAASIAANRTPQQRAVNNVVNFGMEQDAGGFNLANLDFTGAWAAYFGETPIIRGNYTINQNGQYLLDMASSVKATSTTLTITIRPDANWKWQGHTPAVFPVTADDYIWTWQQLVKPTNNVASTVGYSLIYKAVKNSSKKVTFYWHKPFADFKDLFGYIYPKDAVENAAGGWNNMWATCVCGYNGAGDETGPISNGPYFLTNWTPGSGLVLESNNTWYGQNPAILTINGLLRNAGSAEVNALLAGEIDAIYPGLPTGMDPLMPSHAGIAHVIKPGFTQEHIDVEFGAAQTAAGGTHTSNGAYLLKRQWFDQALAMSLNRQGVANVIYGPVLGNGTVKELNNPFYTIGANATKSIYQYFKKFDYAPQKAINLLKSNGCTGGPNVPGTVAHPNTDVWSCGPADASINFYTTTATARCTQSAPVWKQNAIAVGIDLNVHCYTAQPDFFTNLLPTGAFDLAEYAFTGGPDPSGWDAIYQCVGPTTGGQNYKNYCNPKVDAFIKKGDSELNKVARRNDYQNAASLVSTNVAIIPLYARPSMIFYNNGLNLQNSDNPTSVGPLWNAESWSW
jgi:ABC-type transport system substrate-binding protein